MRESATRIVLYPLNVDYPPIPLPPDTHDYTIVGTLHKVLRADTRSTSAKPPDTHDYAIVGTLRKVLCADTRSTSAKPPETGYWAEVPALPGCVTQGETLAETRAMLADAARGWIRCA